MAGDYGYRTISLKEETRDKMRELLENLNEEYDGRYIKYDDLIKFFLPLKKDHDIEPARVSGKMFDGMKEALLKESMVEAVREQLGRKAKNVRVESGSIKADPTEEYIENIGSEEEADKKIEEEAKKMIKGITDGLVNTAETKNKISEEEAKEVKEKTEKELE